MKYSYIYIILLVAALLVTGCEKVHTGDLIFVAADDTDFEKAISASTSRESDFTHVGIIEEENGHYYVIDASPRRGVSRNDLQTFMEENPGSYTLLRPSDPGLDLCECVRNARKYIGRPYDYAFLESDEAIYCSELVHLSYIYRYGEYYFENTPMNFRSRDGTMPEFWTDHYRKLGIDIPEGVPGSSPNGLAKSDKLKEVRVNITSLK